MAAMPPDPFAEASQEEEAAAPPPVAMDASHPLWVADEARDTCADCGAVWSLLVWRHHCRHCGGVFCGDCTAATFPLLPSATSSEPPDTPIPQRVCKSCLEVSIQPPADGLSTDHPGRCAC